jgi:type IV secretion system protein VirB9
MTSRIALSLILSGSLLAAVTPPANGARSVQYGDKDVVRINARLRFTTLIVLPKNEQILDFVCGDKEFWIVNGNQNFAYVKPAKERARTDLNLITASGNVYSFVLEEGSSQPEAEPDLKVFVELRDEAMVSAIAAPPRFVTAQAVEDYRQQMEMAKAETRAAKETAQKTVEREAAKFREDYPTNALKFPYRFQANAAPFRVTAIYHDDKFTYIQASPQETPALYEIKDGKPNLINFEFKNGAYVVPKIVDSGYLAIGKAKLPFAKQQ